MYSEDDTTLRIDAIEKLIEYLKEGNRPYTSDLHHNVFNMDYYIIGSSDAEEALEEVGTFKAIKKVQDYEKFNFGEITTDLSDPEKVANMLFYIIGEEILGELTSYKEIQTEKITDEQAASMIEELQNKIKAIEGE
jgi:hypothetical protein